MSATLLLLPAILLAPVPKDLDAQIKWKLAKGDVFYVATEDKASGTVEVKQLGQTLKQQSESRGVCKYEVLAASGTERVVKVTYLSYSAEIGVNGQPQAAPAVDVNGATVTLTLDAQYNVTKSEGAKEFAAKFGANLGGAGFGGAATEKGLAEGLRQVFAVVPPKGVNGGAKWDQKSVLPMGQLGRLTRTAKCTAAELRDGTGHVVIATVAEYAWAAPTEEEAKDVPAGNPAVITSADLKAEKCKGTVTFDPKRGRLVSSTEEVPLTGTMSLKVGEMTIDVVMNVTTTRTLTVSDKPPAK